ncbi:hypothetical protein H9P43_002801 [Blastocladiella emersonii ATCC 22665]|nr:hypothetical protein H9P43_002801 [Blastocladiella emersonii ATCC 22665]
MPLPAEILAMSEAETACQFCGVSYLILSRMDALQREFRRLEVELEQRKAFAEERPALVARADTAEARQALRGEAAHLRQSRDAALATAKSLAAHVQGTKAELDGIRREFQASLRTVKSTAKAAVLGVADSLRRESDALAARRAAAERTAVEDAQRAELSRVRGEVDALMLELAATKQQLAQANMHRARVQAGADEDRRRAEATAAALRTSLDSAERAHAVTSDELAASHRAASVAQQALDAANARIAHLDTELARTTTQLAAATESAARLDAQLADARAAQSTTQAAREKLIDDLRASTTSLSTRVRALEAELCDTIAAHQNRITQMQAAFQAKLADAARESATQVRGEADVVVQALRADLEVARREVDKVQEQMEDSLSRALADSSARVHALDSDLAALRDQLAEATARASATATAAATQAAVRQREAAWHATRAQLEAEIAALKETVRGECEERLHLVERIEAMQMAAASGQGQGGRREKAAASPAPTAAAAEPDGEREPEPKASGGMEAYFQSKLATASAKKTRKIRSLAGKYA